MNTVIYNTREQDVKREIYTCKLIYHSTLQFKILNSVGVNFVDTINCIKYNNMLFMIKKNEEFKFGSNFVHQHSREKLRKNNPQL